jgi:hypothetical protein
LRLSTTDRLRLDVLLATNRELYSWADAKKFEEGEIDELVTQGAFGTGPFASMLLSVLEGSDAAQLDLPPGLPVTVELTSPPVVSEQAAAGDRIDGRLVNAIRDQAQRRSACPRGRRWWDA